MLKKGQSSINGTVYLTREILRIFNSSADNCLSFAVVNKNQIVNNPVEKGLKGFFKSFADSVVLSNYQSFKCGFTTSVSEIDSYADFICNILRDRPQKADRQWLNYSDRKNLFSSLPIIPRKHDII